MSVLSAKVYEKYNSLFFAQNEGWLGSDGICSIPVSRERTVWLFGDTLLGRLEDGKRVCPPFIHNSIAIEHRIADSDSKVTFHWSTTADGKPEAFFKHRKDTPGSYYWPVSGFCEDGELFILCYSVGGTGFDFSIYNNAMIRVKNPLDPPSERRQEIQDLGFGSIHQNFISACFVEKPYVYFFGYEDLQKDSAPRKMVLARAKISDIKTGDIREALEYWVMKGSEPQWAKEPKELVSLFEPGLTETAMHYDPGLQLYILPVKDLHSPKICIRTSPAITGPWSDPIVVYRVPEHEAPFPIISYATKAHPELSTRPGEIITTYATNIATSALEPLYTKEGLSIYVPRFLRLDLEALSDKIA